MPNAVTHILIPIIFMDIIRDYRLKNKHILTNTHILICGIAGILPDIDVAFGLLMTAFNGTSPYAYHRTVTHSLFIPLILLIASIAYYKADKKDTFKILLMISLGYTSHLILDYLLVGTVMPFYPLNESKYGLNLLHTSSGDSALILGLDTIILLAWLIHEQLKHKIVDYI